MNSGCPFPTTKMTDAISSNKGNRPKKDSNMNATQNLPKVGDKAIYLPGNDKAPIETTIVRVTPKGRIRVAHRDNVSYRRSNWNGYSTGDRHDSSSIQLHTPEAWEAANAGHQAYLQRQEEQKTRRDKERAELDARHAIEVAEFKAACEGDLATITYNHLVLPDGSRLVTLNIPVKLELAARKAGRNRGESKPQTPAFEMVICRLKNEEALWGEAEKPIACYHTFLTGNNDSFSFCSGTRYATDDEALWETASHRYHSW